MPTATPLQRAVTSAWAEIRRVHGELPVASAEWTDDLRHRHPVDLVEQDGGLVLRISDSALDSEIDGEELLASLLHHAVLTLADARGIKVASVRRHWFSSEYAFLAASCGLASRGGRPDARLGRPDGVLSPLAAAHYAGSIRRLDDAIQQEIEP